MSKLVSTVLSLRKPLLLSHPDQSACFWQNLITKAGQYIDDFNEKVETDTLSLREALVVFLAGMALFTCIIAIGSFLAQG